MKRVVAAAVVLASVTAPAVVPARAAPLLASCQDGGEGSRVCTLVATAVTAAWAGVGEYLVLEPYEDEPFTPFCDGIPGAFESYRGKLRGPHGVGTVRLDLFSCPNEHPSAIAYVSKLGVYQAWVGIAEKYSYDPVPLPRKPVPVELYVNEGVRWTHESESVATIARSGADVSAPGEGQTEDCTHWHKEGYCEEGHRLRPYATYVQGRVAGRVADVTLDVWSQADGERSARAVSVPYRTAGWKITRIG